MTELTAAPIRWDLGADAVVTVTLDDPGQPVNTMGDRFRRELSAMVDRLQAERERISGVILTSAKPTFCAGGNLYELMRATPADAGTVTAALTAFHVATRQLEQLGRPVVAAINGTALGAGYELALACHHRIVADLHGLRIGLPEVTLGLLPGGGGTVRMVRLLGLDRALEEVLLTGRSFTPREALDAGLVDEVVAADGLRAAARQWIAAHPDAAQPWDRPGFRVRGITGSRAVLPSLPATLRKQARGPLLPAPRNLVAAAAEGAQVDTDSALKIEARYCTELICGPISANIIQSRFFDLQAVNRGASRPDGYPPHRARKLVVLGAGMMGAGIAHVAALAGLDVVLKDVTPELAERAKQHSVALLDTAVKGGAMTAERRAEVLARIRPTAEAAEAAGADLVIEAVPESPGLKQQVLAEVIPYLAPGAVIASNTSTLPITALAAGLPAAENFIGTHFFSPVHRMQLLEIVVGEKTSDATLAAAIDIARQIGKTPIVVNDSRGFFTSRVITTFLNEAVTMLGEGIPAAMIEQAATQAGYPVGPLALYDEVSLTLGRAIRRETDQARQDAGLEVQPHPAAAVIDVMIDDFGRGGRGTGAGFYDYADGRRTGLWPGLTAAFGSGRVDVPLRELQERMLFAEAIEAGRCLDEGVLRSAAEGNVGSLLGIGYPAWTGGVLRYVEQYDGGAAGFTRRARELAGWYGARFTPPVSLDAVPIGGAR